VAIGGLEKTKCNHFGDLRRQLQVDKSDRHVNDRLPWDLCDVDVDCEVLWNLIYVPTVYKWGILLVRVVDEKDEQIRICEVEVK
jgi:hypothetical protein